MAPLIFREKLFKQTGPLLSVHGRFFVNISASALTKLIAMRGHEAVLKYIARLGMLSRILVLEITEHERVEDMDHLAEVVSVRSRRL